MKSDASQSTMLAQRTVNKKYKTERAQMSAMSISGPAV